MTTKLNLHAKRTRPGEDLSVFPRNGFAMEIQIVLTELMKISLYTNVQRLSPAVTINLLAKMEDASTKDGNVTTITIVEMGQTKENSVIHNTRPAHPKNLLVKTLNVSEINIDVMGKTIAEITRTRWDVKTAKITLVQMENSNVRMANALIIIWFVTKYLIVQMILTSHCIVTWTNALKLKFTNADINVSIL